MAEYYTTLTTIGADKVAIALSGGPALQLQTIAVGDGGGANFYDLYDREALKQRAGLVNKHWDDDLNLVDVDPNNPAWVITEGLIPTHVGGWYIREVGIFDAAGDMIAIGVYPETYKPVATAVEADLLVRSILEVGDADSVELKIDPSQVMATRAWVVDVAIPKALTMLDEKVDEASGHADRAEIARDAAFVNADVYDDVPAGLASGDAQFQVVEGEEIVRYRRIDASNAEEVARYPAGSENLQQGWRGALDSGIGIERRIGDNPHSYTQTLAGGGPENRPPLSLSVQGVGSTGSTYRLNAPGIVARREMINILANPVVMLVNILTGKPSASEEWDGTYQSGIAWFTNNRNAHSEEPISISKIDPAAGQTDFYEDSYTFGPAGSGADLEAPENAVYAIPFFEVSGTTGRFFASRLEVRDVSLDFQFENLDKSIVSIGSEATAGESIKNLYRDGSQGEVFDFTSSVMYENSPVVGETFSAIRSLVSDSKIGTVSGREPVIANENGHLAVSAPIDAEERVSIFSDDPLLMQWPCTLIFSVKTAAEQSGPLTVFWQHSSGEPGRIQITLNARYTGSLSSGSADSLQIFINGITDGNGVNGQPLHAETATGTVTVAAVVMREGVKNSEFWANGRLVDTFTAPQEIHQTRSYLMGSPAYGPSLSSGYSYGRFLTINRALAGSDFGQACEWAAKAFGEKWRHRPHHKRDLLKASGAISLLVPTVGMPEPEGGYDTVNTLYEKRADEILKPASVTKVLTSMVMLDYIDDLQSTIQMQEGDQTGGSANNLVVGDIITYYDALHNMLLPSSNVTTTVVARTIGQLILDQEGGVGDPYDRFIQAMNEKAQQLGMHSSHFTNASGLNNEEMVSTARDIGYMGIAALSYPDIVATWGKPSHTVEILGDSPRSVNINHSIDIINDTDVMGGKTGTLPNGMARNLLLLSKMPSGNFVITVVMLTSEDDRYVDMRALLDYVKASYRWPSSYLLTA